MTLGLVPTLVGVGAALCSMGSFAPQALKILRERDASGVSLRMYVITVIGFSLWSAYGVLLQSWPLVVSNLVCLALSALILALKLRSNGREAGERA
jgi:MtN3 and saliva related transmembrane protein